MNKRGFDFMKKKYSKRCILQCFFRDRAKLDKRKEVMLCGESDDSYSEHF